MQYTLCRIAEMQASIDWFKFKGYNTRITLALHYKKGAGMLSQVP